MNVVVVVGDRIALIHGYAERCCTPSMPRIRQARPQSLETFRAERKGPLVEETGSEQSRLEACFCLCFQGEREGLVSLRKFQPRPKMWLLLGPTFGC